MDCFWKGSLSRYLEIASLSCPDSHETYNALAMAWESLKNCAYWQNAIFYARNMTKLKKGSGRLSSYVSHLALLCLQASVGQEGQHKQRNQARYSLDATTPVTARGGSQRKARSITATKRPLQRVYDDEETYDPSGRNNTQVRTGLGTS
jgi:hypothetical protein